MPAAHPAAPFAQFAPSNRVQSALRQAITAAYRRAEPDCVAALLPAARVSPQQRAAIADTARTLVQALRSKRKSGGVEGLVQEYSLSSQEGVALMCLAEALLRVPDTATRNALIRDKIAEGDWRAHVGNARSLFVNAATWGLVVTGKLTSTVNDKHLSAVLTRLLARCGEPLIRRGVDLAMRMMGEQFVIGETIAQALKRARAWEGRGFRYSYDMLGEAATTAEDAQRYYQDYENAIHAIGQAAQGRGVYDGPGISIKLSALHPRYSRAQNQRVVGELLPKLQSLAALARGYGIGLNIDAEEADRLELSLDLLETLCFDPALTGWDGLGFVVQAYGRRCPFVLDFLIDLARRAQRRLMIRLVKGAYWDAEIKRAQVDGLQDFPVYTRKVYTDMAYIACARKLLAARADVFAQFATHNAQTLATIYQLAGADFSTGDYEFQCLHGMGEALYTEVVGKLDRPCRIYAPVGSHETLLAYLVRRLLENGANSSFVHRLSDQAVSVDSLLEDPAEVVAAMPVAGASHAQIRLPQALYGNNRQNARGLDLSDENTLAALAQQFMQTASVAWQAQPLLAGDATALSEACAIRNPANHADVVGSVTQTPATQAESIVAMAAESATAWAAIPTNERAACLERAAEIMQARMETLMGLLIREAGKSAANAIGEVREAIDFLRYYASEARRTLTPAHAPLGPVVCISPWNFPLAIFTGQVAAALVAGNPVIAKPADTTPLIAAQSVEILHAAGIPRGVLQFTPGDGQLGSALVAAAQTAGVMFTGSTEVARLIQHQLATRLSATGKPIPLIAETGGQNAMIVDSSALAEQVVADVIASAFDSAGQRCSALRILCLQEEIAERTLQMLHGACRELCVGNPDQLCTDVGPVISDIAKQRIDDHIAQMRARGHAVTQFATPPATQVGTFVPPTIIEIQAVADVSREVFGPVLHVLRYRRADIDTLIDAINASGYGLTFGLHTRLDETIAAVCSRVRAGNLYVNRNTIGAVVGVQPFGGRGLSGTGPKAGGPLYLGRLVQHAPQALSSAAQPAPAVLEEYATWLQHRGLLAAAQAARQDAQQTALGYTQELTGPVGERNVYALHPRGRLLLLPQSAAGLYRQISAVLATGNTAVIDASTGLHAALEGLPASVVARLCWTPHWEQDAPYAGVLIEGDAARVAQYNRQIAALAGPLVCVQSASPQAMQTDAPVYCLPWLLEEVSTSVNTTAAGGNASLMSIG